MSITVHASGPAGLLQLVPGLLGHMPADSVVAIPFNDQRRTMGAMRFDWPDTATIDELARVGIGHLCRVAGIRAALLIAYHPQGYNRAITVLAPMQAAADRAGLPIVDLLYVGDTAWGSIAGDPQPLDLIAPSGDFPYNATRTDATVIPPADADARAEFARLLAEPYMLDTLTDWIDHVELAATGSIHDDDLVDLAALALGISRPALRDTALVQTADDRDMGVLALDAQHRWENGEEYPADIAQIMWGDGNRPNPDRLRSMLRVCRTIAALSDGPTRAAALVTSGWLSWAMGRSSECRVYADQAADLDSALGLAGRLQSFVQAGHLPQWAFEGVAR